MRDFILTVRAKTAGGVRNTGSDSCSIARALARSIVELAELVVVLLPLAVSTEFHIFVRGGARPGRVLLPLTEAGLLVASGLAVGEGVVLRSGGMVLFFISVHIEDVIFHLHERLLSLVTSRGVGVSGHGAGGAGIYGHGVIAGGIDGLSLLPVLLPLKALHVHFPLLTVDEAQWGLLHSKEFDEESIFEPAGVAVFFPVQVGGEKRISLLKVMRLEVGKWSEVRDVATLASLAFISGVEIDLGSLLGEDLY